MKTMSYCAGYIFLATVRKGKKNLEPGKGDGRKRVEGRRSRNNPNS